MPDPIRHVIVLMLENASFDRMLGALSGSMPGGIPSVDGIDPAHLQFNPDFPSGNPVTQAATVAREVNPDPEHNLDDVLRQLHGPCQGFVADYAQNYPKTSFPQRAEIMGYYGNGTLGTLQTLAQQFALCDRWFSSLPGPTWPNRFFVHSGTSLGHVDMPEGIFQPGIHLYNQTTVYDLLSKADVSWAIYYGDFPQSLVMTHQLGHLGNYHKMDQFFEDIAGDEALFPQYAFIEPSYFGKAQNDEHPPSDMQRGELLIAQVYNALRANDALWQSSLLVILYDEHGGFFDHVSPPAAVPPDGNTKTFAFNVLGVRVPAVLVSPWIDPGPIHDVFDHTSLLKYVSQKWGLGHLTNRVDSANSFGGFLQKRSTPRTNTPASLPEPAVLDNDLSQPLNANQLALEGYSRFLESKTVDSTRDAGNDVTKVLAEVGERLVNAMTGDATQAGEAHAQAVRSRLDAFFEASRAPLQ